MFLIKNKKYLITAAILLLFSTALNFPFPNEYPIGQDVFSAMHIPVKSKSGLHYVGITEVLLLILGLYFLVKSLEKYHNRMVLLSLVLMFSIPPGLVSAYQKTFASGIYAVQYERDNSSCKFEMKDDDTLYGSCLLTFENHSSKTVRFNMEFYEKYLSEEEISPLSFMNKEGPYEVILHKKGRELVRIESEIDLSKFGGYSISGETWGMNVKIRNGDRVRSL